MSSEPAEDVDMSDGMALALRQGIRAERSRVRLSQEDLAERLGWSRSTLTAVEAGTRTIQAHELPELCGALGVTLAELLARAPAEDRRRMGI